MQQLSLHETSPSPSPEFQLMMPRNEPGADRPLANQLSAHHFFTQEKSQNAVLHLLLDLSERSGAHSCPQTLLFGVNEVLLKQIMLKHGLRFALLIAQREKLVELDVHGLSLLCCLRMNQAGSESIQLFTARWPSALGEQTSVVRAQRPQHPEQEAAG